LEWRRRRYRRCWEWRRRRDWLKKGIETERGNKMKLINGSERERERVYKV